MHESHFFKRELCRPAGFFEASLEFKQDHNSLISFMPESVSIWIKEDTWTVFDALPIKPVKLGFPRFIPIYKFGREK